MPVVRHSGDVEARMRFDPGARLVLATVTDGSHVTRFRVPVRHRPTSEDYDRIGAMVLRRAARAARDRDVRLPIAERRGRLRIRRVFQAPCPRR